MVPLNGDEVLCQNATRLKVESIENNRFALRVFKEGDFFTLYEFDQFKYFESDFDLSNYYTNTHSDSKFVKGLIVSRYTSNNVVFINGLVFSKILKEKRIDTPIKSAGELKKLLLVQFLIDLDSYKVEKIYSHSRKF